MISLRDRSRPRAPIATVGLIVLNLLVYWYEVSLGEARLEAFVGLWGVVPRNVAAFFEGSEAHPGVLVTPLTSMYLHGNTLHLVVNMLYLWVFGSAVEQLLKRRRYLVFYTLCGCLAAAGQVLIWPSSTIPAVGASGAIAGLMAAYLVLRPGATIGVVAPLLFIYPAVDVPAFIMLGLWLATQLLSTLISVTSSSPSEAVPWVAHLVGFLSGLALVLLFRPRRQRLYDW
jgi:membrane associated rhomboid family serine protease